MLFFAKKATFFRDIWERKEKIEEEMDSGTIFAEAQNGLRVVVVLALVFLYEKPPSRMLYYFFLSLLLVLYKRRRQQPRQPRLCLENCMLKKQKRERKRERERENFYRMAGLVGLEGGGGPCHVQKGGKNPSFSLSQKLMPAMPLSFLSSRVEEKPTFFLPS